MSVVYIYCNVVNLKSRQLYLHLVKLLITLGVLFTEVFNWRVGSENIRAINNGRHVLASSLCKGRK